MTVKARRTSINSSPQDMISHSRDFLLGLSRAAQSVQQAHTTDEIYRAVGDQIKSLGCDVTLLMINDDRQSLTVTYLSFAPALLRKIEKLMGFSALGYRIVFPPESIYARNIAAGKTEYVHWANEHIDQALPAVLRPLTAQLMSLMKIEQGILAPLHVEGEPLGLMMVSGLELNEDDVPAMQSFAGQIAAGLRNVRLLKKLQEELSARRQVEEALSHNRNLLLALSRAAQAIQRVRRPEEIYRVMGEQIKVLGFEATILTLDSGHKNLYLSYTTLADGIIRTAEKIVGLAAQGYTWSISPDSIYGKIVEDGKAKYIPWAGELFAEALPKPLRPMTETLMKLLGVEHGIIAPLHVDEETLGLLIVFGNKSLSEEELPAIDSFAGQVAVSLRNARLTQQMQEELSARKLAEEQLLISQSTFEGIFDSITEAIYILDENGIFLKVNLGAEKMYGYPPEYFVGRTPEFLSAHGKNDFTKVAEYIRQAYLGETVEFEFWGRRKDGSIFPKDVRLTPGTYFGRKIIIAVGRDVTERKQAEEAIRQTERHFKALIENAPDGIVLVGLDGIANYASPSARNMFDYGTEDGLNINPLEFIHPDDLGIVIKAMNDLIQDPAYIPTVQYRYKNKDDSWHWVESTFSNLLAESSVQAVVINFRDITERKRAEEALKQSEARYRLLADHTTDTIWLTDLNLKTTYISPSVEKIRGWTLEQLYGLPLDQNLTSHSSQLAMEAFATEIPKVYADPDYSPVIALELEFFNRDGTIYSTESKLSIIRDESGHPISILGESRDIAERRRAEKALYESERYYRSLIENTTDGILVLNVDGTIRYESPSVPRLLGYNANALIGTSAFNLINPDDLSQIAEAFIEGLKTPGYIHRGEYRLLHGSGEWRYFEIVSHYLIDDPVIAGIIINGRDITERKQVESALSESESKFHSVITESVDGIALLDESGCIIEFNNAFEEITGHKRETVLGQPMWELQFQTAPRYLRTDEYHLQVKESIQKALETGQSPYLHKIMDVPFEHFNGSMRFIQQRIFSIRTEKGWRLGSISRDITERKQAEEALRASEESYKSLYQIIRLMTDNLPDLVWAKDMDGCYIFTNKAMSEKLLIAQNTDEPIGKTDMYFAERQRTSHPDNSSWHTFGELCFNSDKVVHASQQPERFEEFGNVKGEFLFLDVYKAPFLDELGNMIGTVGIGRDVTRERKLEEERKKTEALLIQSEQAYRALFENMPIGLYRTAAGGKILDANQSFINMFGYPDHSSMLAMNAKDLYADPATDDKFKNEISECGILSAFEAEFRRQDQTTFWAEDYVHVIFDEARNPLYYEGSLINVTERKRAEDELRHANKSLETAHNELKQMFEHEQVLARTDGLTGLYNRRYFFELAIREFNAAYRYQRPLTIILFDVDGFKQVNDTFGHALGDAILVQIAQASALQVRDVDVLARYGGDEFIILLPQTSAQQAFLIAERLRERVASTRMDTENSPFIVTLSIGVAETVHAPQDESVEDIIRRADQALYVSKKMGRNNTVIYTGT